MSKYDFEIDLSLNSSTGLILNKLRPGSVVLEFGCATGRMTRYMKEAMGCRVYIVEYDNGAFQKAVEFAEDGICDDIQTFSWATRFGDISFDAIIFADVLEHLQQPEEVLKKAAALLKEDGFVYISIPNVTHNDVILKAVEEHFDYSKTGLLDDTHIHFWGLENIGELSVSTGLSVVSLEGTYCPTGSTEQSVQLGENRLLENILRERRAGEVYQFVVTMAKHGTEDAECTVKPQGIKSHIYLDTGRDFNSEEQIPVNAAYSGNGSYLISFELENADRVQRVRLDPVEWQGVLLRSISIRQNGEELQLVMPNAVFLEDGIYLPGDDPMVFTQVQPGKGKVTFEAEFILPGQAYVRALEEGVRNDQVVLARTIEENRKNLQILHGELAVLNLQKADIIRQNAALNKQIQERENQLLRMQQDHAQLQVDLSAYIALVNRKEKLSIEWEQRALEWKQCAFEWEQRALELERLKNELSYTVAEQEKSLNYYRNLRVVRLRAFVLRVLRKIKRCIKKILGRIS